MMLANYGYRGTTWPHRGGLPLSIGAGITAAVIVVGALSLVPIVPSPVMVAPDNTSVAAKADRPAAIPDARVVRTIPISRLPAPTVVAPLVLPDPAPQSAAPPAPAEAPPAKVAQYIMPVAPPAHTDVCKRHGGYKEVRGRSWHCVYPARR